jgi:hypothetical protein
MKVNIETASDVKCSECENLRFVQVYVIKRLSPIVSPTGEEILVPVPTFACAECGNINDEFVPNEVTEGSK